MSRLIDANALMRSIEPIIEAEEQIYRRESWGFAIKCRNAIDDAPTIDPEPMWIPVSEKAHPTKEGKYLVTDDAGGMATVDVDDFIYCDDGSGLWLCSQNVTAWMPYELPEPYRNGGGK